MSVQNKPDYKIFASGAKPGEVVNFPDVLRGWGVTLDTTGGIPPMEFANAVAMRLNEWLMYLTQRGIPEWESSVDYPNNAVVQHSGIYYASIKANKGEQPNNSQLSWKKLSDYLGVNDKVDKSEIVKAAGNSETKVMSQKAVTDELRNHGIGGILKEMSSATEGGFYLSASGSDDNPEKDLGFVIINMAASGHYKTQIAVAYATSIPRVYIRNIFGDEKQPWEQIATKVAIDALNDALSGKQPKGDYLPKSSPSADTRISVTAQDYPALLFQQTSTGDKFEFLASPERSSLIFKFTPKSGSARQINIPFSEISSSADIGGQRIRKLYSGSGASPGQSFSFGINGVGKTLVMFHDNVAKIQALVTTQPYTSYTATGAGTSISMGVYPDRATFVSNTGPGNITEIWLVG